MAENLTVLVDMGFEKAKAEKALCEAGGDLQGALNNLIEAAETGEGGEPAESTVEIEMPSEGQSPTKTESAEEQLVAKSLKCEDCGKLFRCHNDAEFHAAKTKHANFSESTEEVPEMTAEEKEAKLQWLKEKMQEKKAAKDKEEKKSAIELEKQRRRHGQEMTAAKERMREKEMKDIAEERRRQKVEDRAAKQRVLDQIKADREAKKKEGQGQPASQPSPATPATVVAPPPPKNYDQCKLQIRLTNGATLTQTFQATEQLAAVRLFVTLHRTDGESAFSLMTPFPRKVFTEQDMETPLKELGLVPSAVIVVTRAA